MKDKLAQMWLHIIKMSAFLWILGCSVDVYKIEGHEKLGITIWILNSIAIIAEVLSFYHFKEKNKSNGETYEK